MDSTSDRSEPPMRRSRTGADRDAHPHRESRAARRLREAQSSRESRRREDGVLGLVKASSGTTLAIGSGRRLSALAVLAFSLFSLLLWMAPGAAWTFGPVIALAGIVLATGWHALTGIEIPVPTTVVLALAGAIVPMIVALTGDLADAVGLFGLAVIGVVASTVMTAPRPRDHSIRGAQQSGGEREAASTPRRRPALGTPPTVISLASALSALALIGAGSAWIALDALPQWSIVIPIAAIVAAAVVWGDQIGSSYRAQSLGALATGLASGILTGIGAYVFGKANALTPIVLPGLAESTGPFIAVAVIGVGAGLGVALTVIVLDGLLGDHTTPHPPLGALARGAAKFLVAALPIYTLIRIGGV